MHQEKSLVIDNPFAVALLRKATTDFERQQLFTRINQVQFNKDVADHIVRRIRRFQANQKVLIIDENMSPAVSRFFYRAGFQTIEMSFKPRRGTKDATIFDVASRMEAPIITHDGDYLEPNKFNPAFSPGVFVIPLYKKAHDSPFLDHISESRVLNVILQNISDFIHCSSRLFGTLHHYRSDCLYSYWEGPFTPNPERPYRWIPTLTQQLELRR
jgi:hypothetical protein